jgi:hypothetical protein
MMTYTPFKMSGNYKVPWKCLSSRGTIIFTFVITLSVSFAVGFMLFWHAYLAMTNQTTIEFYFNKYKEREARLKGGSYQNPYNLGVKRNWYTFFGVKDSFSWLLPNSKPIPGDGFSYPTKGHDGIETVNAPSFAPPYTSSSFATTAHSFASSPSTMQRNPGAEYNV